MDFMKLNNHDVPWNFQPPMSLEAQNIGGTGIILCNALIAEHYKPV